MAKKAQGMSMNVIIVAAIALLVLVVLSIIFLGRSETFSRETTDCVNKGGQCKADCSDTSVYPEWNTPYPGWKCANDGDVCCIKLQL